MEVSNTPFNVSYPPIYVTNMPPQFGRLAHESAKAVAYLLIPSELLYFAVYFYLKKQRRIYHVLNVAALVMLWLSPLMAPITCTPASCLQNFASTSSCPYMPLVHVLI